MAAEIQPQPQARKPCLLTKIEAFQDVVSTAVIIPREDGVISVSEDRYAAPQISLQTPGFHLHCFLPRLSFICDAHILMWSK